MSRQRFRRWRQSRPWAAGMCTTLAGAELLTVLMTAPGTLALSGAGAPSSWILAVLMMVAGLTMWLDVPRRYYAGALTLVCGLLSLVLSNLGGYLLGFFLASLGGSLALAWHPRPRPGKPRQRLCLADAAAPTRALRSPARPSLYRAGGRQKGPSGSDVKRRDHPME